MKFVVLSQHTNLPLKLGACVLSLQKFLLLILDLVLLESKGSLSLEGVAGLFKFHNNIDISDKIVRLVGGVFGH